MPEMATIETIGYAEEINQQDIRSNTSADPADLIGVLLVVILFPFWVCYRQIWISKKVYNHDGILEIIRLFLGFLGVFCFSVSEFLQIKNLSKEQLLIIPYFGILYFCLFLITWGVSHVARKRIFYKRLQALVRRERISMNLDYSQSWACLIREAKQFLALHFKKNAPISIQN